MPRKPAWRKIADQPSHFALQILKAFHKNQGLLLSGALAYYTLLSVIPLFTFLLLMLSHVIDEAALMATLRRYIGLIIPGDSAAVLGPVRSILEHREVASWVVLITMLFFSSLAFSVLESAMSIIFVHRVRTKNRPLWVSLLLHAIAPHDRRGPTAPRDLRRPRDAVGPRPALRGRHRCGDAAEIVSAESRPRFFFRGIGRCCGGHARHEQGQQNRAANAHGDRAYHGPADWDRWGDGPLEL
jgi:hypothetical protein